MRFFILIFLFFLLSCSQHNKEVLVSENQKQQDLLKEPQIPFNPKSYICYRTDEPILVDGKMIEDSWQAADWTDDFVDIEGDIKPKPRFQTRAKMLWDDQYFYFFSEMEEPHVWAKLKKRDSVIFYDNDFEVFIDPNGDTHQYYELEINAFSTEWDLFLDKPYRDSGRAMFFWDIGGLKTKTFINGTINQPKDIDQGWTLEIAIPWEVLKEFTDQAAPPETGDQWRVNFSRVEWQVEAVDGIYEKVKNPETQEPLPENNWVWSPQGIINMHYPEMWGFVQFSTALAGDGSDQFKFNKEENVKWALRQIYYKQKNFFVENGIYTSDVSDLKLENIDVGDYRWPPIIKYTDNLYEAVLIHQNEKESWHISQDGKVWKQ